jgi:hypothetical protein
MGMEFIMKFGIRFNSKFSNKRDIEVITERDVGIVMALDGTYSQ